MSQRRQEDQWWDDLSPRRKTLYNWGVPAIYCVNIIMVFVLVGLLVHDVIPLWIQTH